MKQITKILLGSLLVVLVGSNAFAQGGLRIELSGEGPHYGSSTFFSIVSSAAGNNYEGSYERYQRTGHRSEGYYYQPQRWVEPHRYMREYRRRVLRSYRHDGNHDRGTDSRGYWHTYRGERDRGRDGYRGIDRNYDYGIDGQGLSAPSYDSSRDFGADRHVDGGPDGY